MRWRFETTMWAEGDDSLAFSGLLEAALREHPATIDVACEREAFAQEQRDLRAFRVTLVLDADSEGDAQHKALDAVMHARHEAALAQGLRFEGKHTLTMLTALAPERGDDG